MIQANRYTPLVATLLVAPAILFLVLYLRAPQITFVESPQTSTRYLADGTEGLTKQTALHLSKMQGGASIGGFPGFEPPDDDKKYRSKIEKSSYTGEEVEHWLKEINNFLRQIATKNPRMTLLEILEKQGLNPSEVDSFVGAIRNLRITAEGFKGYGVTESSLEKLIELMRLLGVQPW